MHNTYKLLNLLVIMTTTIVTRNGQITLAKDIREQLGIQEGHKLTLNVVGNTIMITKRDPSFWKKRASFLEDDFEETLNELRENSYSRFI